MSHRRGDLLDLVIFCFRPFREDLADGAVEWEINFSRRQRAVHISAIEREHGTGIQSQESLFLDEGIS